MDAVLGQPSAVKFLHTHLTNPPHLILWGPTGVGKTMLANAWISEQLKSQGVTNPDHQTTMTLRLSSADDRGITAIRQRLTEFVRRVRPITGTVAWVLLDDADNLPVVTQQALRRILELHAHQTRFCFVAQSPEHFIEPIQSRCVVLQCLPVSLYTHGPALAALHAPGVVIPLDTIHTMAGFCIGNVRQFTLICRTLRLYGTSEPVRPEDLQLLINIPPILLIQRLQAAIIKKDLNIVTECVLALWSKGYSFEDCVAMLESVVRIYATAPPKDLQYVLQCCAEAHIAQILNRMTTLDLIAVLSGRASSTCLTEV